MSGYGTEELDVSKWPETGLLANLTEHLSLRLNRTLSQAEVCDAVAQRIILNIRQRASWPVMTGRREAAGLSAQ